MYICKTKRILGEYLLALVMILCLIPTVGAMDNDIVVKVNGQKLNFDVSPTVVEGRTLVPLRVIFEALGAKVMWNENTKVIIGTKGNINVILQLDSTDASVNGEQKSLDVAATLINNRTFVPIRFVSESLGANVNWDESTNTISITDKAVINSSDKNIKEVNIEEEKKFDTHYILSNEYFENKEDGYKIKFPERWIRNENKVIDDTKLTLAYPANEELPVMIQIYRMNNLVDGGSSKDIDKLVPVIAAEFLKRGDVKEISRENIDIKGQKAILMEFSENAKKNDSTQIVNTYLLFTIKKNTPYLLTANTPNYAWEAVKTVLKQSLCSFEPLDSKESLDRILKSKSELLKYLQDNFSELETNIGTTHFTFDILENERSSTAYDYWIQVEYEYDFFEGAMGSNKYSRSQKDKLKEELKVHMEGLGKAVIKAMPDKKFEGGYYDSWYKYPNLKMDLQTCRYYSWTNFDDEYYFDKDAYEKTKPSSFRWDDSIDDEL